ncbi:ABC-type multidrug transport system fused ATPase/permease subunit [Parabacteroides sp. PF5-5]|uniref:hypothetical protein n=1 Tax=unclassified Parabacteroides TaxID=2649774 RepID=UPI0024745703|nr:MULTISPECIES: hypothetical protein [unclassified Parabacteroides]MDH6303996.1 ABC-type multidrug transport system fused ATPase/permease subunit [Parabacteroides sp. PH5-39]MDH6315289.1 ABC-type multidrug transport system fused ATPase/permease subunit [Parabacteroides sp. PF5-13]MDH6318949.1 ABC-type multidrug transport system fused ATPase/permease subunit [Parabacteroides sp. PH5-13]MDH6322678.1 ABC-type multidrug transport system fused ATPase/permease subunit [Parabacteroides sp. PH5-8]MDH
MTTRGFGMRFLMSVGFLVMAAALSAIIMLLWNWLMPTIFGLIAINLWQALGLLVLARILFGRFSFGRNRMMGGGMRENPIHEKWMKMTPEQREEFINKRRQFGFGYPFNREHFGMDKQQERNKENE